MLSNKANEYVTRFSDDNLTKAVKSITMYQKECRRMYFKAETTATNENFMVVNEYLHEMSMRIMYLEEAKHYFNGKILEKKIKTAARLAPKNYVEKPRVPTDTITKLFGRCASV